VLLHEKKAKQWLFLCARKVPKTEELSYLKNKTG
jgi:hypothetical protein